MMHLETKMAYLEECLDDISSTYADSFKTDIAIFIGEFNGENPRLHFLHKLTTEAEIAQWVNHLTSRIVLKFDEEGEQLSDLIHEYMTYE